MLENRLRDSEATCVHTSDTLKRLSLQAKLDYNEKQTLAHMTEALSVRLHRAEEALKQCQPPSLYGSPGRDQSPSKTELHPEARLEAETRRLTSQCRALTSKLRQYESEGQYTKGETSPEMSPVGTKSLGTTMRSVQRTRSSTSLSPVPGGGDPGRSKTPTPSQAETSRAASNPHSPLLAHSVRQSKESLKPGVQEVVLTSNPSNGRLRLSRRTSSDRKEWKR